MLIICHLLELPERKVYRKIINQAILPGDSWHRYVPSDVSAMVAVMRDDILVVDGGMVHGPGPVDFHFNVDSSPGKAAACQGEIYIEYEWIG
jgi:hypothetical protein